MKCRKVLIILIFNLDEPILNQEENNFQLIRESRLNLSNNQQNISDSMSNISDPIDDRGHRRVFVRMNDSLNNEELNALGRNI
jgi:hypothetical protein